MQTTTDTPRTPTAREADAIERLRLVRVIHTAMTDERRYTPPELQANLATRLARQQREVRALCSIIRRERRDHPGELPGRADLDHAIAGFDTSDLLEWVNRFPTTYAQVRAGIDEFYETND